MSASIPLAGSRALRLVRGGARGRVAGVFAHGVALEAEDGTVLWLDRRRGALSERGLLLRGPLPAVRPGAPWRVAGGFLLSADARGCREVSTPRGAARRAGLPARAGAVRAVVAARPADPLALLARRRARALAAAIGGRSAPDGRRKGEAEGRALLGLGPGLTPSGDDLLAAFLLTRGRLGHADAALRETVRRGAPSLTHPISAARLLDALDGSATLAEGRFLDALLGGSAAAARRAACRLLAYGASSGADFATGALEAVAA